MQGLSLKQKKVILLLASVFFVLAETVLGFAVQLVEYKLFSPVAYSAIVLVFVFSFVPLLFGIKRGAFVRLGLFFTLGADFCLVIMNPEKRLLGVIIFIFAQLSYAVYLYLSDNRRWVKILHISLRAFLTLLSVILPIVILGDAYDILSVVSVFYYAQLISSLIVAFVIPKNRIFAVGLVLFALCDLSIGLNEIVRTYFNVSSSSLLYKVTHSDLNIAWIFYVPSQTVIALSLLKKKK